VKTLSSIITFFSIGIFSYQINAETLEKEISRLLLEHPQILSLQSQVDSSKQGVKASLSAYLPTLDLTADTNREYVSTPALRSTPDGPTKLTAETWNLTLNQNLYDGGLKTSLRSSAKITEFVTSKTLESVTQAVLFEGIASYLDVLRQSQLIRLSNRNSENIRQQLDLEDARVKRGSGVAVDVLSAKSRLQISLERLAFVNGAFSDAKSRYDQVFGRMPILNNMVMPKSPRTSIPRSLEEAVSMADKQNPAIQTSNAQIDLAYEGKRAIQAELFPNINLVVDGGYESDFNAVPGIRRDYAVRLKANWNLFNGLNTTNRSKQAAYDLNARKSDYEQTKRKVEEQTRLAWQALQTARQRLDLLENAVNIAAEVFESRKKLREAGKETVINVLDAENEVFSARINYTSAFFDTRQATYQLLLAVGKLSKDTIAQ
jgi:adhesin transport system outer membrane protein